MNDAVNAEASDQDLARNLGSRQPESRSAAFGAGILGSEHVRTSDGLSAAQQRYAGQVAAHYMVDAPGPAYGGAAWNGGGGELATGMSGPGRPAIEGPTVVAGAVDAVEDAL